MSSFTFQHLINVVFIIPYPPVITQLCAQHLLRDSILGHINHWVSILSLYGVQMGNKELQCAEIIASTTQNATTPASFTVGHLDKIEQTSETPRHRVEPLRPGVRPLGVNQLSQVTVGEVAAATTI